MRIGIMAAMPDEIAEFDKEITLKKSEKYAGRDIHIGKYNTIDIVVMVMNQCGKAAGSSSATILLEKYKVDLIILVGTAGAVDRSLNIGDIVIADNLFQLDINAEGAGFKKFEIPLLGKITFGADKNLCNLMKGVAMQFVSKINTYVDQQMLVDFKIDTPSVKVGTVATGDQFSTDLATLTTEETGINNILCVEMEGAAVAQVCYSYEKPLLVVRVISDKADDNLGIDFNKFLKFLASIYAKVILKNLLEHRDTLFKTMMQHV
jgi:adenosylhomocysteine nucleosidase